MRRAWPLFLFLACGDAAPPPPKAPEKPKVGEWTAKAGASQAMLAAMDPKSTDAERECATARTAVRVGTERAEQGIAEMGQQIEQRCVAADAWGLLLRMAPQADGPNRVAYCLKASQITKRLEESKVDVATLREEHAKACPKKALKFEPTGELAKIADMDPKSKQAMAICRDAHTDALQVKLRDRTAGEEQERTLNAVCALPDLWAGLQIAADKDKPQDARDSECIGAKVWIGALAKAKQLKGKPLAQARSAFGKACKKWQKVDPMKDLAKLEKLDPKAKDARGICSRAARYVEAAEAAAVNKDIKETHQKACARVEGWYLALDGTCATAMDRIEKKRGLVDAGELKSMTDEARDRCK